jgi:hypothetical protein
LGLAPPCVAEGIVSITSWRMVMHIITPNDVEKEAVAQGASRNELQVPAVVFLTFNR